MKSVCAWCAKPLPLAPAGAHSAHNNSVCSECLRSFHVHGRVSLGSKSVPQTVPALVLDRNCRILAVSQAGAELLDLPVSAAGFRFGDVIACAETPDGCGCAAPCEACSLRYAVRSTYMSGLSLTNVSSQHRLTGRDASRVALHIEFSTERVGYAVLLVINRWEIVAMSNAHVADGVQQLAR